jgi:hypothetical protein
MRILFLTQVLPYPLDAGPKVRAYYVLQYLAARHDVTLVSFSRSSDTTEAIEHLRSLCREVHVVPMLRTRSADLSGLGRSLRSGVPFTITRDERPDMRRKIDEVVSRRPFDAIHADQLSMASYALWAQTAQTRRVALPQPRMVLDAHNAYYLIPARLAQVTSNPALKLLMRREARLTAHYEAQTYRQFDTVLTVTTQDLAAIQQIMASPAKPPFGLSANGHGPRWITTPICVDAGVPMLERNPSARGLLMLGGLHWPPNADAVRWFSREMWPLVSEQSPGARLFVVGARPPADIQALGDFTGIERPEQAGDARVIVTGYVPDPAPFIRESAALVVALRSGGGMRVKIVEALQWGLPVISTTVGCEGIDVAAGQDALVTDEPRAFAQAATNVLCDDGLAQRLSRNGRRLVEQHYHWRTAYTALEAVYNEA